MWKWIKIPNIGALVAFFLPWLTVSCSGTPIGTATGWQLAFGGYSGSHQFGAEASSGPQGNGWLILALIAILCGIVLAFLRQSKKTSIKAGWSAGFALVFILLGTVRYSRANLIAQASANGDNGFGGSIDQAALAMVQVTWEIGYWIAIMALIASAVMSWLAYSERELSTQSKPMQIRTNKPT